MFIKITKERKGSFVFYKIHDTDFIEEVINYGSFGIMDLYSRKGLNVARALKNYYSTITTERDSKIATESRFAQLRYDVLTVPNFDKYEQCLKNHITKLNYIGK